MTHAFIKNISIKVAFLLVFFVSFKLSAQDYTEYHDKINQANDLFFIHNQADSSLLIYKDVFAKYPKHFAIDVYTAFQIALYAEDTISIQSFAISCFHEGITMKKIQNLKLYQIYKNPKLKSTIANLYPAHRKIYLNTLDTNLLALVYSMWAEDQANKTMEQMKTGAYHAVVMKNLNIIDSLIGIGKFPTEDNIGLAENLLFKELGFPEKELYELYEKKYKNNFKDRAYIYWDDELFPQHLLVLLYHNDLAYDLLKTKLQAEVTKGNLHPRDLATILEFNCHKIWYDFDKKYYPAVSDPNNKSFISGVTHWYFNVNKKYNSDTLKKYSINRKDNHINSINIEYMKTRYEMQFGFELHFGILKQR